MYPYFYDFPIRTLFSKSCAQNADLVTKCILKILVSCRASADVIKNSSKTVNSYTDSVCYMWFPRHSRHETAHYYNWKILKILFTNLNAGFTIILRV